MAGSEHPGSHRAPAGERHHVTVLFTDVCDSTELGRQIEPEQVEQVCRVLRELVDDECRRRGGLMVRAQGDGTVAVFGYPHPEEDDGVRAAEVALAVHQRLPQLAGAADRAAGQVNLRSGIHSGICFISEGDLWLGLINLQGDMVNTTAHVQKLAEPGGIVASLASLGPHDNMFELKTLAGDANAPGRRKVPATLELVQVLGRRGVSRRYDATAQRGLTPFIGRSADLEYLQGLVDRTEGVPRCTIVQAGPGLGKTRLLEEFVTRANLSGWQVLRGNCESFGNAEVLQPFMQMTRAQGVVPDVTALAAHFAGACHQAPVLVLIDDWQWADDASRQLLVALLGMAEGPRVILASRPREDGASWIADAPHLTLLPFDRAQTESAVRRWMPAADPFLIARIHEYAGGVPLYIEELCHSTSDKLWESLDGRAPVQTWLTTLVAARLDRLARLHPARAAVVRAAAVVGNVVPVPLLQLVCDTPLAPETLKELADADFLYPGDRPDALRFKHGITRDAVYEAIGLYERMALHRRILEVLLPRAGEDERAEDLEALAYHARGAAQWERAAQFAERAGDRAIAAHAMDRARAQYHATLNALDRLPRTRELSMQWCTAANKLALTCIFDALSIGPDIRIFEEAVTRSTQLGDSSMLARSEYWLAYIRYALGDFRVGIGHAREALRLAQASGDARPAAPFGATLGQILAGACEYDEALALMNEALSSKWEHSRRGGGVASGSAYTLSCKGIVLADRGEFAGAHVCFNEALDLLGASMHPAGTSVRNWITISLIWQGRWQEAQKVGAESARIAENTRTLMLLAVSRTATGFARWCSGEAEGHAQMREAVQWMDARGVHFFTSLFNGWLCEASVAEGHREQARHAAAVVLRRARQGERLGEAVACRAMALSAARDGDPRAATRWMRRADASAAARRSPREEALNRATRSALAELLPQPLATD